MRTFHHLSLEEREKIFGWRKEEVSFREIGRRLNRPHTRKQACPKDVLEKNHAKQSHP